ncbi:MAG TPA: glycosyltransferase family 39 protein [Chryseosolibacter sp.]
MTERWPLLKDVRFWIVLFFVARLYAITSPPLELAHSWRQTDGAAIARNFYEIDANIFYPRIDLAGDKSGIAGSEFPLLNYLIYLCSVLFGYDHWYGRLIVLLFSSIGAFYFFNVIRMRFSETLALTSTILLMSSFWFSYSRKIIPDVFAASLCIIALYYALRYLFEGKIVHLLLFVLLGSLGCLSKIIAASLLTVLALPLLDKTIALQRKLILSLASALIFCLVVAWYFWWVPHLNAMHGSGAHFFMGMSYEQGFENIVRDWKAVLRRLFVSPLKYVGAVAFVVSLVVLVARKQWLILGIFSLPFLSYLTMIARTGSYMVGDHYYILTMIPAFTFLVACGVDQLPFRKASTLVIVVICAESVGDQFSDFRIKEPFASLAGIEAILDTLSKRNDLIIVNGEPGNPTFMYFAHRRGWTGPNSDFTSEYLTDKINRGAKFLVVAKKLYGDVNLHYPISYDSDTFRVYKLVN